MRLIAWNLGHQCREDKISDGFLPALSALQPDLLSLNEYVHGESRTQLIADLTSLGLKHIMVSDRLNGNNQILVASKYPLVKGDLYSLQSKDQASESNFLHVVIPSQNFEFVGLRAPAYSGEHLRLYWENLMQVICSSADRRIVYMGDFNTDPDQVKRSTSKYLRLLRNQGWNIPSPEGEWSYISPKAGGTRIDHAVVSEHLSLERSEYVSSIGDLVLASSDRRKRISDHAPIVVELSSGIVTA